MGAHASAKIATAGLVFHYDKGSDRSYPGAPVTNSQWNSGSEFAPWKANGSGTPNVDVTGTAEAGPIKTAKTWKFIKDGTSSQWNGWEASYGAIWTGSSGDIWTTSYWYKTSNPAGHGNFTVGGFYLPDWSRAYNYTILSTRDTIIADGTWRYNYTVTRLNENYTNAIIADGPSWNYSTTAGVLYINGLQWNKNSYATKFAKGTRTSSQSIVSLANTATMNVNLSYAYDGTPYFNGTSDYIDTGNTFTFSQSGQFSVEVWLKILDHSDRPSAAAGIIGKGHYYDNGWDLFLLNNNSIYFEASGDPTRQGLVQAITPVLALSTWHHCIATYNNGAMSVYLNGVLVATQTYAGPGNFSNSNNVLIGKRFNDASRSLRGEVPVAKIYNRALTASEIQQNFVALRGRFGI